MRPERGRDNRDQTGPSPTTPPRSAVIASALGVLLLLAAVACGGGDDESAGTGSTEDASAASATADPDRLENEILRLLADHDAVVNQIITDPAVTESGDDPLVEQYLDLYEPGSEFADQTLETWRSNAAEGISIRPYDDAHPANLTRLDGEIEVVSDDEVRFPTCQELRQIVYQGDRVTSGVPFQAQAGESVAVLVDGSWVFQRRDVFVDAPECATPSPDAPDLPEQPDDAETDSG